MLVDQISSPDDLKQLSLEELQQIADETRQLILEKDSHFGGHVGPNLGVVELTVAFHYVFDSPKDKMIWDVSHQSYAHKILTGRKYGFEPEHYSEITGYTNQHESSHDFFTIGHTSTSISLATGVAKARDLKREDGNVVALIGDGSLSGGLAFEGLNNAGRLDSNIIIIVNDNEMSIDENQGSLYPHLADLRNSKGTSENNLFKALGFDYRYVENANDLATMIEVFKNCKDVDHPVLLHVHTEKGHGYQPALANKMKFHWSSPFDLETGEHLHKSTAENYADILGHYMIEAAKEKLVVGINAAVPGNFGLKEFQKVFPDRYFDVGIAEQHSITFTTGLASQGIRPVVFHSSTFLQRAYDQLIHDLALNNVPGVLVVRGGAISSADRTHQGDFDIPMISSIPNIKYLAPATVEDVISMMDWALEQTDGPVAIRIPSGAVQHGEAIASDYGRAHYQVLQEGQRVAILALGAFLPLGKQVAAAFEQENVQPTLINPGFITEVDKSCLEDLLDDHDIVITLEDGSLSGGFGEMIARYYGAKNIKVLSYGADKEFTDAEPLSSQYERYHLTPEQIVEDTLSKI